MSCFMSPAKITPPIISCHINEEITQFFFAIGCSFLVVETATAIDLLC